MNRLMEAARRRAVDAIVCWKIDRWGRSMPGFVGSVQELVPWEYVSSLLPKALTPMNRTRQQDSC